MLLQHIPPEVLALIFTQGILSYEAVLSCRRVCSRFKDAIESPSSQFVKRITDIEEFGQFQHPQSIACKFILKSIFAWHSTSILYASSLHSFLIIFELREFSGFMSLQSWPAFYTPSGTLQLRVCARSSLEKTIHCKNDMPQYLEKGGANSFQCETHCEKHRHSITLAGSSPRAEELDSLVESVKRGCKLSAIVDGDIGICPPENDLESSEMQPHSPPHWQIFKRISSEYALLCGLERGAHVMTIEVGDLKQGNGTPKRYLPLSDYIELIVDRWKYLYTF